MTLSALAPFLVVLFCGLLIGLALFLLVRTLRKIARGQCCGGCAGCPESEQCDRYTGKAKHKSPPR